MSFIRTAAIAVLLFFAVNLPLSAAAHGYSIGELVIHHPWSRATAPSAKVAAGYLVIENKGREADRLISATFSSSATVELHDMAVEGGVMRMRELPLGIDIPAGGKVELKPGGLHMMFMGLSAGLKEGENIKGLLVFEKAGRLNVDFKVESIGARGGNQPGDHGHHGHGAGHTPKVN